MMVLQLAGAAALARLMTADARPGPDLDWLLFGPTDPAVTLPEEAQPAPLLAAE